MTRLAIGPTLDKPAEYHDEDAYEVPLHNRHHIRVAAGDQHGPKEVQTYPQGDADSEAPRHLGQDSPPVVIGHEEPAEWTGVVGALLEPDALNLDDFEWGCQP